MAAMPLAGPADRPSPEAAIELFHRRFLNRTDCVAIQTDKGTPRPVDVRGSLDAVLLTHVLGRAARGATVRYPNDDLGTVAGWFRVGTYCPGTDNLTKWLCLDLDGAGHAGALADATATALAAFDAFAAAGLPAYLERSGGGKGWHLWCFFDPPIEAAKAQALGRALAPKDAPLEGGGVADPIAAKGVEVFPKQATIAAGGYGNLVYLPLWRDAPTGANLFYRRGEDGALEAFVPDDLAPAPQDAVERVLASVATNTADVPRSAPAEPAASPSTETLWAEWRERALAALPLEPVYGAWLTEKLAGAGWRECRDPASASGDQHPSASVADGTGQAERGTFHSHIDGRTLSVFDFLVAHGGCADFRAARARVAELTGVPEPRMAPDAPAAARRRKPRIVIRTAEHAVVDEAIAALSRIDGFFCRGQLLVQVVRHTGKLAGVVYPPGSPRIVAYGAAGVRDRLTLAADWIAVKQTNEGEMEIAAHPPAWAAPAVEARMTWPGIRPLEGVVESPVLRPDGSVVADAGYDDATGLLYQPDADYPPVPERPTQADARAAAAEVLDLVCDFPFRTDAHRAAWLAALLTLLARFAFYGPAPLFLMDANVRGAGKSLLADLIGVVVSGRQMPRTPQAADENEEIKRITAIALGGDRFVLIDNIDRPLGSGALDSVLTGTLWSERILGKSEKVTLPLLAVWYASGNNVTLKGDTARRCLHVRLDSDLEKPEHRDDFKHKFLLRHAFEHRASLVRAALTILRAYSVAGRPSMGLKPWGSFEGWSMLVRNAVVWAGCSDPGDTRADLDEVDTDANVLADLLAGWEDLPLAQGIQGCTVAQALEALRDDESGRDFSRLRSALGELCPHPPGQLPTARKVGYALRRFHGRVVHGRKLQTRIYAGNRLWYVQQVADVGPPPGQRELVLGDPSPDEFRDESFAL